MFSFTNISAALLVLATAVRAEFFITSFSVQGNATTSLTWTSTDPDTDPLVVSIELQNPSFHSQFALGTTVPSSQGTFSVATPGLLPGPGYTLQLIATNNVSDILAQTPDFEIFENKLLTSSLSAGPPSTSSSSTASSSSTSSSNSASTTSSASATSASSTGAAPVSTPSPVSTSSSSSAPNPTSSAAAASNNNDNSAAGLVPAGTAVAIVASFVALFL